MKSSRLFLLVFYLDIILSCFLIYSQEIPKQYLNSFSLFLNQSNIHQNGQTNGTIRRKLDFATSSFATFQGFSLVGIPGAGSLFGYGMDAGGDINGDGWIDYLIGAHGYNGGAGITNLYYGGTSNSISIYGEAAATYSGVSVAFTGDVNKDGSEDFIIGAYGGTGKAYLVFGKPTMNNINLATLGRGGVSFLGAMASDYTGFCVAGGGDINGDTYPDMLVGAYGASGGANVGKVYVIFGRSNMMNLTLASLSSTYGYVINGIAAGLVGHTVDFIGDVNNDGYDDIITGAYGYSSAAGVSYLIYGGSGWSGVSNLGAAYSGQTIYGLAFTCFGIQAHGAGDVNNDGIDDFLVGAHCLNAAYLIYGKSPAVPTINLASLGSNGVIMYGGVAGEIAGIDVYGAGDVNGDGYADMLIGAAYYSSNQGRVYLVYGGASLPSSISLGSLGTLGTTIYGPTINSYLGWRVRSGDINHDGKSDIIVSAYGYNGNQGAVYVIYGAVSGYFLSAYPTGQPSSSPTNPSSQPSRRPSSQPTSRPSRQPTRQPTSRPSSQPSRDPTSQPSRVPSSQPSADPSSQPTRKPSSQPSSRPSSQPSRKPTSQPSCQPSRIPSGQPTCQPSSRPTGQPTCQPSSRPSSQPSSRPSNQPTRQPSSQPSSQPTRNPTSQPSTRPIGRPSCQPTGQPSSRPSTQPSVQPSTQPTRKPSNEPTSYPTVQPSAQPSSRPSNQPSSRPTNQPSSIPISHPSTLPTSQPSLVPSSQPSRCPSTLPSDQPSSQPSGVPTIQPSALPSAQPTSQPSAIPSSQPISLPTTQPSSEPSSFPSSQPSSQPTCQPSGFPSSQPRSLPTTYPSAVPSPFPSSIPTDQPSSQPSSYPSSQPSVHPSRYPSSIPSNQPTAQPSAQPSGCPSLVPSSQPSNFPISQPSTSPSRAPSSQPSSQPANSPSEQPVSSPSSQPSMQPSALPTSQPSGHPSNSPSSVPSSCPSDSPFIFPTSQPSSKPTLMDAIHFNSSLTVLPATANLKMSLFFFGALYEEDGCVFSDVDTNVGEGEGVGDNYVLLGTRDWKNGNVTADIVLRKASVSSLVSPVSGTMIRFPGAIVYEQCARSLAMVDYNGDTRMDVIVGNPVQSEAYLLLGQSKGLIEMNSGLYMLGESKRDYFGFAVSGAGDFNGDGLEDVIVSAILRNRCYVILGKGNILRNVYMSRLRGSVEGFVIEGSIQNSYTGVSVSSAGDMNGDGLSEVVLSALGRNQENVIYVVYGRRDVSGTVWLDSLSRGRGLKIVSRSFGYAGYSLSGAGDVNGDGYDEIIIGSLPNRQGVKSQESYVLYGGVGYGVREGVNESVGTSVIQLEEIGERGLGLKIVGGGLVVSGIGDIDGDGLGDVMVTRYEGWQGKSAAMMLRYPEMLIPTSYPTSSPSLSVTIGGSRGHKATQHPTLSPSLRPSFRPSLAPSSRAPSISPAPTLSAAPSSPTSSPSPARQLPSASPFISQAPTYSVSLTGAEATCVVIVRTGGRYDGCDDPVNVFKVMSNESVELSGRGRVNRYEIWGSANMTVWLLNFSLDWDVLDLSAIKGVGGLEDLSYGLDPLMLYLPEGQRIEMSGMDEFELTSENVLFGSDKGRGGGGSGKVELDLSSLSSSLSPLASPQVVGALGMMLFFLTLTCVCSRLESPNLKEMKVKADKRRAMQRDEEIGVVVSENNQKRNVEDCQPNKDVGALETSVRQPRPSSSSSSSDSSSSSSSSSSWNYLPEDSSKEEYHLENGNDDNDDADSDSDSDETNSSSLDSDVSQSHLSQSLKSHASSSSDSSHSSGDSSESADFSSYSSATSLHSV